MLELKQKQPFLVLERQDLTAVWEKEVDFSFDLANNPTLLKQLGDELGFDLALEATEVAVGPFRADIVCKDRNSLETVIIENQRGLTDHDHLGKLMTYVAGTNATNLIWIAEGFQDDHLAAIRWLNDRTDSTVNAFAVQIELWSIQGHDELPPALKLNVLAKPNRWVKFAQRNVNLPFYEAFWKQFRDALMVKSPNRAFLEEPRLTAEYYYYMGYRTGVSGARFYVALTPNESTICITLELTTENAKQRFDTLMTERTAIEAAVGECLEWNRYDNRQKSEIFLLKNDFDFTTESGIAQAIEQTSDRFLSFYQAATEQLRL